MKTRLLFSLLASATAVFAGLPKAPIYEENFNETNDDAISYVNGAFQGPSGSGVSGVLADRAYVGVPKSLANHRVDSGVLALKPIAPNRMAAFTCAFWYYLDEKGPE